MGLLDDAIREHLDLKRRRGADPTEIERAEREALGPVRRGPELTGDAGGAGARGSTRGGARRRAGGAMGAVPTKPMPRARAPLEEHDEPARLRARRALRTASPLEATRPVRRREPSRAAAASGRRGAGARGRARRPASADHRGAEPPAATTSPLLASTRRPRSTSSSPRRQRRSRRRRARETPSSSRSARARPALVRAAPAARLRLRRLTPVALDSR